MKSSFILSAHLCSGNMAAWSSSHPQGIPHSMPTLPLGHGGAAVPGRLFQVLLVVSSGGCSMCGGMQSGIWLSPAQLSGWRLSPGIHSTSGAASAVSGTAGHLEEGGCLNTWSFAPGSKPNRCILLQACASLSFISIQMTLQQWICPLQEWSSDHLVLFIEVLCT